MPMTWVNAVVAQTRANRTPTGSSRHDEHCLEDSGRRGYATLATFGQHVDVG
jgi:hypothetical protein